MKNIDNTNGKSPIEYLKERVFQLKTQLFGKCNSAFLPEQVSLLEGFIILAALGDSMVKDPQGGLVRLKQIRAMVSLRNNSIFAHGLIPVKEGDFLKFKRFVDELFRQLCEIEGVDFNDWVSMMTWISPLDVKQEMNGGGVQV